MKIKNVLSFFVVLFAVIWLEADSPPSAPPKKNSAYVFWTGLVSQVDTKLLQSSPTLAAGDVKVSINGGAFANLGTLPVVTPASTKAVKCSLAAAEMNGDNIIVLFSDAAGAEWCDQFVNLQTGNNTIDSLRNRIDTLQARVDTVNGRASTINTNTTNSSKRQPVWK